MHMTNQQSDVVQPNQPNTRPKFYWFVVIMLLQIPIAVIFYAIVGPKLSATLVALFLFWSLDIHLKKSHGLGTDTAFVDLSFTALVLSAGLAVDLIAGEISPRLRTIDTTLELFIFITLLISWLINLSLYKQSREQSIASGIPNATIVVGLFSAIVVVFAATPLRDMLIYYMLIGNQGR